MPRPLFSANTGYLWRERPFLERIKLASELGFDGVEFHDEAQRHDVNAIKDALQRFRLPVISLNANMRGMFGTAALPGREDEARKDIAEAIEIAEHLKAGSIHILSGCTDAKNARGIFISNIQYALDNTDKTILLEPISDAVVPGYFLNSLVLTISILDEISNPRLKVLYDCFHVRHETADIEAGFNKNVNNIGHVQISSFPARNEPFDGEIAYSKLIFDMMDAGYDGFFGCEYNPRVSVESGINWWETFKQ